MQKKHKNIGSSHAHVARCICRRTERIVIKLSEESKIENIIIIYLNRLSDYLFVLARFLCLDNCSKERIWEKR
ncbi:MAG: ATP:cob(I)alamin adenosyltransferase [bacterium]